MEDFLEKTTSLGVPVKKKDDNLYRIDLSELKPFTGLSVIARMLGDDILEQIKLKNTDTVVRRKLIKEITPELVNLGINRIIIYSRSNVLKKLPDFAEEFHDQIRTVFGTLQRPRWGGQLFPELFSDRKDVNVFPALLFPFHLHFESEDINYYFLVERDSHEGFLRISIEPQQENRLNLSTINHVVVDDLEKRNYLQGLSRFVDSIHHGIMRENENFKSEYTEVDKRHNIFFTQIRQGGLPLLNSITFFWRPEDAEELFRKYNLPLLLRKVLLVLEDRDVSRLLNSGKILEVAANNAIVSLDISRLGRSLNVSLLSNREIPTLDYYIERMPLLNELSMKKSGSLKGYYIFLIHHITSEILGTIKALEKMGCEHLDSLFVKYAGIVPADYLEVLLSQDENFFKSFGLHKIESSSSIEGYYTLSQQYSKLDGLEDLESILEKRKLNFFEAMKLTALYLFLFSAEKARSEGKKILLIEDGGYLAPLLNKMSKENRTLDEVLDEASISPEKKKLFSSPMDICFKDWISPLMPGTVEHTRNGYDRLQNIERSYGELQFPAVSIALSNVKLERESQEVSSSLLHALESILHGLGYVLSERNAVILGSKGAIGKNLILDLQYRMNSPLKGIDIAASNVSSGNLIEADMYENLPFDVVREVDLIIGVVGKSILKSDFFEKLIAEGNKKSIFILSGSTKTVEFTDLTDWLSNLQIQKESLINGLPFKLENKIIRDPQTSTILGKRVIFNFENFQKNLYLLGGLTPLNFLYYGVPTETMDTVLMQLLSISAGLIRRAEEQIPLPNSLLALDYQINLECDQITEVLK